MMHAFVPLDAFLPWLLAGWRFHNGIAEPMQGHHGNYSCLMVRGDD